MQIDLITEIMALAAAVDSARDWKLHGSRRCMDHPQNLDGFPCPATAFSEITGLSYYQSIEQLDALTGGSLYAMLIDHDEMEFVAAWETRIRELGFLLLLSERGLPLPGMLKSKAL